MLLSSNKLYAECSAAVGSIADDRHTHRSTTVSSTADGRRTMTHSM
ncbi:MAG: hypothetical protein HXL35_02555 [Prevotellaceae bacterium]|nr:hypothetical protein [Prevotellaceae bacterium]